MNNNNQGEEFNKDHFKERDIKSLEYLFEVHMDKFAKENLEKTQGENKNEN